MHGIACLHAKAGSLHATFFRNSRLLCVHSVTGSEVCFELNYSDVLSLFPPHVNVKLVPLYPADLLLSRITINQPYNQTSE